MVQLGWTQVRLGKEVGLSQPIVQRWLAGSWPAADNLMPLARALGVTIEWLLTGEGTPWASAKDVEVYELASRAAAAELKEKVMAAVTAALSTTSEQSRAPAGAGRPNVEDDTRGKVRKAFPKGQGDPAQRPARKKRRSSGE